MYDLLLILGETPLSKNIASIFCARPHYRKQSVDCVEWEWRDFHPCARAATYFCAFHLYKLSSRDYHVTLEMELLRLFITTMKCLRLRTLPYTTQSSVGQHESRRDYKRPCAINLRNIFVLLYFVVFRTPYWILILSLSSFANRDEKEMAVFSLGRVTYCNVQESIFWQFSCLRGVQAAELLFVTDTLVVSFSVCGEQFCGHEGQRKRKMFVGHIINHNIIHLYWGIVVDNHLISIEPILKPWNLFEIHLLIIWINISKFENNITYKFLLVPLI